VGEVSVRRAWRAARTGFAFLSFGIGAIFLSVVAFPGLRLIQREPQDRELTAQRLIHLTFRLFVRLMEALGLIRVTRIGTERLRAEAPLLVVANHPTLIDVVLLVACLPQADCVVKRAYWAQPIIRRIMAGAGYIANADGDALVSACAARLVAGRTVLLFPEGTRSPRAALGTFKRGAAHIALQSGATLIPVLITCDPPTLMRGQRWYDVPARAAHLTIEVTAPLTLRGPERDTPLAARRLTAELRQFYEDRLSRPELQHARR
jgi:1-acyl-sn-glycerol-3-phosphate acyltransferase